LALGDALKEVVSLATGVRRALGVAVGGALEHVESRVAVAESDTNNLAAHVHGGRGDGLGSPQLQELLRGHSHDGRDTGSLSGARLSRSIAASRSPRAIPTTSPSMSTAAVATVLAAQNFRNSLGTMPTMDVTPGALAPVSGLT